MPTDKEISQISDEMGGEVKGSQTLEDFMKEGLAAEKGKGPEDFDPDQLNKGIEAELEHTSNREIATKIAMDHLTEFPDYYTALEKMEEELKKKAKEKSDESEELSDKAVGAGGEE